MTSGILFLQIGGTIDKGYPAGNDNHGYAFEIGEPAFLSIINRAGLAYSYSHDTVLRKDSLDMTDGDRALVCRFVREMRHQQIIITHGTDTILQTAQALHHNGPKDKVIVLTGAMLPEKFRDSDADFNLGMAVAAVQCLPPGVYVALNGTVKSLSKFQEA